MGVSQVDLEFSGIVAHPDIMGSDLIVELKDTVNGKRLDITDQTFRAYLRQLLYYIVIAGFERGIISIRYNIKELRWIRGDEHGDYYFNQKMQILWEQKVGKSHDPSKILLEKS